MAKPNRPNVVLFLTDQWRAKDTGYWGNTVIQTPHTDRVARDGAGFRWCFVQNPVSTPSRVTMATGWYCHVHGHRTMHHMVKPYHPDLLRYFKDVGYHIWWGGKNDMICEGLRDEIPDTRVQGAGRPTVNQSPWELGDKLYHTFLWGEVPENFGASAADDHVAEKAAEFIKNSPAEPFLLLVNQTFPHPPYAVHEPYFSMYDRGQVPMPIKMDEPFKDKPMILKRVHERMRMNEVTDDELREMVAVYYGMCTKTDRNLGWIIDALEESGQWDNTIAVVSSDHGDFVGDYQMTEKMQNTFEDCLVNVPFAIRVPGIAPLPRPSEALIEMIDLLPTLLEACDIPLTHTQFGKSLLPVMRGEIAEHKPYVFSEGGGLIEEEHTHETARPKENIYWSRPALQWTERETHGKAVMIRSKNWKYVRRMYDTDELYDLENDPGEVHNLINDPAYEQPRRELSEALLTWFVETGDVVPWRWDRRGDNEEHPPWSADVEACPWYQAHR